MLQISKAENSSAYTASSSSSGEFDEEKNRNGAGQEHEQIGERQGNSYTYTGLRVTQSHQDRLGRVGNSLVINLSPEMLM